MISNNKKNTVVGSNCVRGLSARKKTNRACLQETNNKMIINVLFIALLYKAISNKSTILLNLLNSSLFPFLLTNPLNIIYEGIF